MTLSYRQRPAEVQAKVDAVFRYNAWRSVGSWLLNGSPQYHICRLEDEVLIRNVVQNSPAQSDYYFLDVGAGLYQWVNNAAKILCNSSEYVPNSRYHIIGVNFEGKDEVETIGNCTVYRLDHFKTENMIEAFQERGLYLENKLDLVVSRFTLRHLVDGLGTFLQMYELTKPGGLLFVEGIPFVRVNFKGEDIYNDDLSALNMNVLYLLKYDLNTSYLMCPHKEYLRNMRDIMIRKNSSVDHINSLHYTGELLDSGHAHNACNI